MQLPEATTFFFHGIGGSGMRNLAWLLQQQGKLVTGTDAQLSPDIADVFSVVPETEATPHVDQSEMYIHSDAVAPDHQLMQYARSRGKRVLGYHEALGEFASNFTTIAVAGTHGKSSTTAFLAHILITAGLDPTVLIGAAVPGWPGGGARMGKSEFFVVEADEYRNHFHTLHPVHLAISSLEFDHPDFFKSVTNVTASFQRLIDTVAPTGSITVAASVATKSALRLPPATTVVKSGVTVPIPGTHMEANAALAVAVAERVGVHREQAVQSLMSFPGLHRRFEILGTIGTTTIISDYAHHPTEIAATLAAARQQYSGKSIAIIFEAHTAERLVAFGDQFAIALSEADGVWLYPPYLPEGRSVADGQAAFQKLQQALQQSKKLLGTLSGKGDLAKLLSSPANTYDYVLACTAGQLDVAIRKTVNPK